LNGAIDWGELDRDIGAITVRKKTRGMNFSTLPRTMPGKGDFLIV